LFKLFHARSLDNTLLLDLTHFRVDLSRFSYIKTTR